MSRPRPQSDRADPVLGILTEELQRSREGLRIPGSPRPYFMQYTVRRVEELRLRAAYGSLVRAHQGRGARIFADIRVGNHRFDNVIDGGLDVDAEDRESSDWLEAPDDLDPTALQYALWKLGQIKFDEALEDYYDHRKATVSEYLRDQADAFTRESKLVHLDPLHDEPFPRAAWETMLRDASRRFLDHPQIYDPSVTLRATRVHRWLATSEGTRVTTEDVFVELDVGGWILTEDGVYEEASVQRYVRSLDGVPGPAELDQMVDGVVADLAALDLAVTPGAFLGPALLSGQAASTLFHEALGHRLEGERLIARGETRTFARKRGERVLPPGLRVYDDPRIEEGGTPVWGGYRVDDQGVVAQRAELVEDGILRGFLCSRNPIPEGGHSNGHGRHDGKQPVTARMGHMVVEGDPAQALTRAELEARLLKLARQQGRSHAIVVERVEAGETSTDSYDFQVFKGELAEVYRIDVETGRRERVRDLELIGTPLSALQRIVAYGRQIGADHGYCYAESGAIPVSGRAPDLLLSELELQQRSTTGYHEPLLPPPFADDGSRGRTGGVRSRGRRRNKKR